jgi:hypothetical protein
LRDGLKETTMKKGTSRRDFLEMSALGLVAAVAPTAAGAVKPGDDYTFKRPAPEAREKLFGSVAAAVPVKANSITTLAWR